MIHEVLYYLKLMLLRSIFILFNAESVLALHICDQIVFSSSSVFLGSKGGRNKVVKQVQVRSDFRFYCMHI